MKAHGGSVEDKIPRVGYVLIVPDSAEAIRLRTCWDNSQDRPDRFFVPFTYVEACIDAGAVIKRIFVENEGTPMRFHIDSSIANVNIRQQLKERIVVSVVTGLVVCLCSLIFPRGFSTLAGTRKRAHPMRASYWPTTPRTSSRNSSASIRVCRTNILSRLPG
jgi:hypothetical protein